MKRLLATVAALAMAATLWGCGAKDTGMTKVRLNEVTHSVFYAPQYVALEKGFFADEGLDVELTNGGGADKVMTAVVAGQSDIGLAGPESCVYLLRSGKEDVEDFTIRFTMPAAVCAYCVGQRHLQQDSRLTTMREMQEYGT